MKTSLDIIQSGTKQSHENGRYSGTLAGFLASLFYDVTISDDLPMACYGMSVFIMWMRTLEFVLVQQKLGQVR